MHAHGASEQAATHTLEDFGGTHLPHPKASLQSTKRALESKLVNWRFTAFFNPSCLNRSVFVFRMRLSIYLNNNDSTRNRREKVKTPGNLEFPNTYYTHRIEKP